MTFFLTLHSYFPPLMFALEWARNMGRGRREGCLTGILSLLFFFITNEGLDVIFFHKGKPQFTRWKINCLMGAVWTPSMLCCTMPCSAGRAWCNKNPRNFCASILTPCTLNSMTNFHFITFFLVRKVLIN